MTISDGALAIDDPMANPDDDLSPATAESDGGSVAETSDDLARQHDELAQQRRLTAWLDCGATSIPALLVALGSAVGGTLMLFLRRRRRRA